MKKSFSKIKNRFTPDELIFFKPKPKIDTKIEVNHYGTFVIEMEFGDEKNYIHFYIDFDYLQITKQKKTFFSICVLREKINTIKCGTFYLDYEYDFTDIDAFVNYIKMFINDLFSNYKIFDSILYFGSEKMLDKLIKSVNKKLSKKYTHLSKENNQEILTFKLVKNVMNTILI